MRATEVHLYGFDSMFDLNLRSNTDLFLESDRSNLNTHRLATNWRPIWSNFFKEFPDVDFTIYHRHDKIKFPVGKNVNVIAVTE